MTSLYIDSPAELLALLPRMRAAPWVALDTEFMRERTFFPQLCLLQVAGPDYVACIDPLRLDSLEPLFEVLLDPHIVKVLHAAHQDLEVIHHACGRLPAPVFDTQVAAALLGAGEQIGYAALVQDLLGVTLDKSQSRTDWARRPLHPAQIAYAADDVRYLREVFARQQAELARRGRSDWLTEDCAALVDPARYTEEPEQAWHRVKGHQNLRGVQLAVLRALAAWREQRANTANRPRRWIVADDTLLELARRSPADLDALARIGGVEAGLLQRHGEHLLDLIATARAEPRALWPSVTQRLPPGGAQAAQLDALQHVVQTQADELGIAPSLLASRRDLERLVDGARDVPLLRGWRARVAGQAALALLSAADAGPVAVPAPADGRPDQAS